MPQRYNADSSPSCVRISFMYYGRSPPVSGPLNLPVIPQRPQPVSGDLTNTRRGMLAMARPDASQEIQVHAVVKHAWRDGRRPISLTGGRVFQGSTPVASRTVDWLTCCFAHAWTALPRSGKALFDKRSPGRGDSCAQAGRRFFPAGILDAWEGDHVRR